MVERNPIEGLASSIGRAWDSYSTWRFISRLRVRPPRGALSFFFSPFLLGVIFFLGGVLIYFFIWHEGQTLHVSDRGLSVHCTCTRLCTSFEVISLLINSHPSERSLSSSRIHPRCRLYASLPYIHTYPPELFFFLFFPSFLLLEICPTPDIY